MAYTMTHILIAEKVLEYLPEVTDVSTYILGTIAPDAVHANTDYTVSQKEKSHLFASEHRWGEICDWDKAEEWFDSIKSYYMENCKRCDTDFLLGYLVHLLADIYNSMYFYTPFMQSIRKDDREAVLEYKKELSGMNRYLFMQYSKEKDLERILHNGKAVGLEGVITQAEIRRRVVQLFETEFQLLPDFTVSKYGICTEEKTVRLIQGAADFIKDVVKEPFLDVDFGKFRY